MPAFLALLAAHYLADFPLQADFIAKNKGKVFRESIGFHVLTAHAAINGLILGLLADWLGHEWLPIFLTVALSHWLIDFAKAWEGWPRGWHLTKGAVWAGNPDARGLWGINVDQALHVLVIVGIALAWSL